MNLLIQSAIKIILSILSFLIRKDWLKEDQAFAFFQVIPISDITITALVAREKSLTPTTTRNRANDIAKYYKTNH